MLDYQNPKLPVACRVAALMARMTLEEKAAQTCMLCGLAAAAFKAFRRIHLKAEKTMEVTFHLDYDSFKTMNIRYNMTVEPACLEF